MTDRDPTPASPTPDTARHARWEDLPWEPVTDTIRRRIVNGHSMMIAQVFLDKGAVVPKHSHLNEQITYIVSGALHFRLGENLDREVTVRAGEVLHIPAHLPHEATALEDTLDVDVFSPPRADWLDGSDAYFHAAPSHAVPGHAASSHAAPGHAAPGHAAPPSPTGKPKDANAMGVAPTVHEPEAAEPQADGGESTVAEPEASESAAAGTQAAEPQAAGTQAAEPRVTEPKAAEPQADGGEEAPR